MLTAARIRAAAPQARAYKLADAGGTSHLQASAVVNRSVLAALEAKRVSFARRTHSGGPLYQRTGS